jgi:hypothetical protein
MFQPEDELRVLARAAVLGEITFRMEKLWRIFSWVSAILVALTGGIIALRTTQGDLGLWPRVILGASIFSLAAYAILWLDQNLKLERSARDALENHDKALRIQAYNDEIGGALPRPDEKKILGYKLTVFLLAAAAFGATVAPIN